MKTLVFTLANGNVVTTPPGYVLKLPGKRVLDVSLSSGAAPVKVAVSEIVAVELREAGALP
jgi:hypothetical protein